MNSTKHELRKFILALSPIFSWRICNTFLNLSEPRQVRRHGRVAGVLGGQGGDSSGRESKIRREGKNLQREGHNWIPGREDEMRRAVENDEGHQELDETSPEGLFRDERVCQVRSEGDEKRYKREETGLAGTGGDR